MAAATPSTGQSMKLYYNSATVASPTWVLIAEVEDVNLSDASMGTAALKRRSSNYAKSMPTLIQPLVVEFTHIYIPGNTVLTALRGFFLAGTPKQFAMYNDLIATTGSEGWKIPAIITSFPWNQPNEDVSKHDMKIEAAFMYESAEVDPAWAVT